MTDCASFAAVLRQLSVNQTEGGFELFCELMQAEADALKEYEGLLRREVTKLAMVLKSDRAVGPEDAYTHPFVLTAARRLEAETGCLLIGPALGWLLHVELHGHGPALPRPATHRVTAPSVDLPALAPMPPDRDAPGL